MTSIEALCDSLEAGVNLRVYIGPADSLCRVMAGDVITHDDILTDSSPYVRTLVHEGIVRRLRFMVRDG